MSKLFPIPIFNGDYLITKEGKIWSNISYKSTKGNIWRKTYFRGNSEYVGLSLNGKNRTFRVKELLKLTFPEIDFNERILDGITLTYIPEYERLYSITECGNIYSHITNKWLIPSLNVSGYLCIDLRKNNSTEREIVSRLVAQTFIPNPENKPQVNHIDGNKLNNHVSNLEWATNQENVTHAVVNNLFRHPKRNEIHSKYKGIHFHSGKWQARKCINGKRYHIGTFLDEQEAYQAYLNFRI